MNPIDVVTGGGSAALISGLLFFAAQIYRTRTDRAGTPSGRVADLATVNVRLEAENGRLLARVDKLQARLDIVQQQIDDERDAHRAELAELRKQLDTMTTDHRAQMDAMSARLTAAEERYRRDVR